MFVVGLTGGIGSGKSTIAERFARLGVSVIDTDVIARTLTAPGAPALAAIHAHFGDAVMQAGGELDRAALRRIVFHDPAARAALETILHPPIRREVERQLGEISGPYALVVIPLLVETGAFREIVQRVLVVDCPEPIRVGRVMARSGLGPEEVRAIMATQASDATRLAAADDVIDNAGPVGALDAAVAELHARYLKLAGMQSS